MKHAVVLMISASHLLNVGLSAMLKPMRDPMVAMRFATGYDPIRTSLQGCSLIIADPLLLGSAEVANIRNVTDGRLPLLALSATPLPPQRAGEFDAVISIYDTREKLEQAIRRLIHEEEEDNLKDLSAREKDVVIGIVKGLSNKEIANEINVSVNTVMTHRRNIAQKLQIHSPAGLTIYAIVKKLVKIEDIKQSIS